MPAWYGSIRTSPPWVAGVNTVPFAFFSTHRSSFCLQSSFCHYCCVIVVNPTSTNSSAYPCSLVAFIKPTHHSSILNNIIIKEQLHTQLECGCPDHQPSETERPDSWAHGRLMYTACNKTKGKKEMSLLPVPSIVLSHVPKAPQPYKVGTVLPSKLPTRMRHGTSLTDI